MSDSTGRDERRKISVFISSQMEELKYEREVAQEVLTEMNVFPVLFEIFSAQSSTAEKAYLDEVQKCDIFVLLLGRQYSSATEDEYREAIKHLKPILVFVRATGEKHSVPVTEVDAQKLAIFYSHAKKRTIYKKYETLTSFRKGLKEALATEIAKFYSHPGTAQSVTEMYDLGIKIINHSGRRLYIFQKTPTLLLYCESYQKFRNRNMAYERRFLSALENWINRNFPKSTRSQNSESNSSLDGREFRPHIEFRFLFSYESTMAELNAINQSPLRIQIAENINQRILWLTRIEQDHPEDEFSVGMTSTAFSGPQIIGDSTYAMWVMGGDDPISISQENLQLSDLLCNAFAKQAFKATDLRDLAEKLGVAPPAGRNQ